MRDVCDVVVVGAGFAGAATAYHLGRLGVRDVVVIEQEQAPGVHSSGRNAAMARQTALTPAIAPLAEEGVRLMREPPAELELAPVLRGCGSLILMAEADAARRVSPRWLGREAVVARVPVTAGGDFAGAVFGPEDGVVDIAALLEGYLRAASRFGARLRTGERVVRIASEGGRVAAVTSDRATFVTKAVVNAAGAWAGELAGLAGAVAAPLRPFRRHLFLSGPLAWVDPAWPIVWDVSHGFYFRPEPPGLLLSPCDETEHVPGLPPVDPAVQELLAAKVRQHMPRLAEIPLARSWAGLRTLTPDGHFVIGRDPRLEGFVWCAGLGGHGVTTSSAVGRLAAEAVLGKEPPAEHDPGRFDDVDHMPH